MGKEIIETYTEEILYNRLKEFGMQEKYIDIIKENIKTQMYSLIRHWNDVEFKKAMLIIGEEEAKFYEPDVNLETKEFAVITIRNSYLERAFSVEHDLVRTRQGT